MQSTAPPNGSEQDDPKASKADNEHSLGQPAEAVYDREAVRRDLVLERAREVAQVTIPSLVPPLGYQEGDKLYTPHQSFGARGVNNISSRLLLTLMPPDRPLFKHEIPSALIAEFREEDPEIYGKVVLALAKRALSVTGRTDTTPLRATTFQVLRLLNVAGNCLMRYPDIDSPTVHGMESYIVKRDNKGNPLLSILLETVAWAGLPESVLKGLNKDREDIKSLLAKPVWERTVKVYTVCKLAKKGSKKVWLTWQEVFGKKIRGSEQQDPFEAPPQYPLWMVPAYGFDWGRGYADEYIGDLISLENKAKAIDEGAAAAALSLLFVKPGSRTRLDQVKKAKNLDVMAGDAADLSMFRTEKQGDFNFVVQAAEAVEKRLSFAFLLNSAIQRSGERVTAEEIKLMARELDEAMGGTYAVFAQTIQGFTVNRALYLMERSKELAKVPTLKDGRNAIRAKIVTGLDALGNSREVEILDQFMEPYFKLGEPGLRRINMDEYGRRKAAGLGIDPQGLVKDAAAIAQEDEQQAQSTAQANLIDKATGPAINAIGKVAPAMLAAGAAPPTA
jgi:hypothetical protein